MPYALPSSPSPEPTPEVRDRNRGLTPKTIDAPEVLREAGYDPKMAIDRAGWPFVLGALAVALVVGWWFGRAWAVPFLVLGAFFVFFFRDPDRHPPVGDDLVLSPADARIMVAGEVPWAGAPAGEWKVISMFLSPVDVHVNRIPVAGTVSRVEYHPGKFLPAYKTEAGELNEWTEVWIDRPGGPVVVRQIVGVLARRIVCRVKQGDRVQGGERFGVMKFGSRIDLFLPRTSTILVKAGDKVVGGEAILARLATEGTN